MAQAGDKCDFIGTPIVVPDVSQMRTKGGCVWGGLSLCVGVT